HCMYAARPHAESGRLHLETAAPHLYRRLCKSVEYAADNRVNGAAPDVEYTAGLQNRTPRKVFDEHRIHDVAPVGKIVPPDRQYGFAGGRCLKRIAQAFGSELAWLWQQQAERITRGVSEDLHGGFRRALRGDSASSRAAAGA